jgi:hypothetical protein
VASYSILMRMNVRDADPTGEECLVCGDVPYLAAKSFGVLLGPDDYLPIGYTCPSCAEVIHERCRNVTRE